jgi:hypothetical protein
MPYTVACAKATAPYVAIGAIAQRARLTPAIRQSAIPAMATPDETIAVTTRDRIIGHPASER